MNTSDNRNGDTSPVAVVGIGASAGGIEALGRFFGAMPVDSGSAFVVVLHLDPTRESGMAHVLGNYTKMPVVEADKGMRLVADHVYVIVPDRYLRVRDGMLDIDEPDEPRGHRHPVDALFDSLAGDQRERAVAIILSGTGTNGTQGLKAIKAEGGLMLVQDPGTAKFDGMPRSAIAADMADHVLAPEAMPEALLRYLRHDYIETAAGGEESEQPNRDSLNQVLKVLDARGHDFAGYKESTLRRRIHRRVSLRNITAIDQYVEELRTNPDELTALAKDLMISVSGFFRDQAAWKALAEQALGPLVNTRDAGGALRMWVPGCATGEEAYSLAMLASELAEAADKRLELKVFATDAQDSNVNKGRDGVFPAAATEALGSQRRRRFFDKLDGSYQVKRELRNLVTFAPQNLMRDPPFSRMDLISCRNLLIYLEPETQERVLALCHFALREGGYLFLGNAETVGRRDDLFEPVSKKWRIYRRLGPTRHDIIDFPLARGPTKPREEPDARQPVSGREERSIPAADAARRALLERYAPASVLIDQRFRVLYFHGPTSDYLEQPTGEPTRDLLSMAREGLAGRLRTAVREALAEKRDVATNAIVGAGKAARPVIIRVMPLARAKQGSVLVSFEQPEPDAGSESTVTTDARTEIGEATSGERVLQEELNAVRAELNSTVEHMETANEELKASNEEVTSMNEELQSTNEELETSKEELQSFNEELHTVNNQLQHKVRELEDKTNDLNNLLAGTETATLFLDTNLCIKWFSPKTQELFSLESTDVGRPVGHFASQVADENLLADAKTVLKELQPIEVEVRAEPGKWYLRRMLPYRTLDHRISGVVITFTDITERKRAADAINESRIYAESIVHTVRQPLLVLDGDLRVRSANPAFYQLFRVSAQETEGQVIYELGNGQWDIAKLRTLLEEVLSKDQAFSDVEIEYDFRDIGLRCMVLNGRKLSREGSREELILLAIEDITDRRDSEHESRWLASVVASSSDAIASKDLNGNVTSWNKGAEELFGYTAEEMIGQSIVILIPPDRADEEPAILERIARGETVENYETLRRRKDGSSVWISLSVSPLRDAQGNIVGASKIARDITERRRAEAHKATLLRELNHRVKNTLATVQAIAAQTLGNNKSIQQARDAFGARLIALSGAHDLLTRESWQGADLADVVRKAVEPLDEGGKRFQVDGPSIQLNPGTALSFAMALHELATNAAKYGALSTEKGRVAINWSTANSSQEPRLRMEWRETGGPLVSPPKRKGFGSRLIGRALAQELGGEVRVDYDPAGVICTIDAPLPATPLGGEEGGH